MADEAVVHVGENSPEYVAYMLFEKIIAAEATQLRAAGGLNRRWILDTYAECLLMVKIPRPGSAPR